MLTIKILGSGCANCKKLEAVAREAERCGCLVQRGADRGHRGLGNRVADAADQKSRGMCLARMHAGGKGVQALDPVCETLLDKEIQRAIGDGGLIAEALGGKAGQHVISAKRLVFLQQDFQHTAADGSEARAGGCGQFLGPRQSILRAMRMVMRGKGQIGGRAAGAGFGHRGLLTCYDIT